MSVFSFGIAAVLWWIGLGFLTWLVLDKDADLLNKPIGLTLYEGIALVFAFVLPVVISALIQEDKEGKKHGVTPLFFKAFSHATPSTSAPDLIDTAMRRGGGQSGGL